MISGLIAFTLAAISSTGCLNPPALSHTWIHKASIEESFLIVSITASTETGVFHSFFISVKSMLWASQIFPNLSPNLPELIVKALLKVKLVTHASIAPVPLEANITASGISKISKSNSLVSLKICSNSGVLWCKVTSAIAFLTNSGTGVGPGVNNINISLFNLFFYEKLYILSNQLLWLG